MKKLILTLILVLFGFSAIAQDATKQKVIDLLKTDGFHYTYDKYKEDLSFRVTGGCFTLCLTGSFTKDKLTLIALVQKINKNETETALFLYDNKRLEFLEADAEKILKPNHALFLEASEIIGFLFDNDKKKIEFLTALANAKEASFMLYGKYTADTEYIISEENKKDMKAFLAEYAKIEKIIAKPQ
jgi:hypothetical protein